MREFLYNLNIYVDVEENDFIDSVDSVVIYLVKEWFIYKDYILKFVISWDL